MKKRKTKALTTQPRPESAATKRRAGRKNPGIKTTELPNVPPDYGAAVNLMAAVLGHAIGRPLHPPCKFILKCPDCSWQAEGPAESVLQQLYTDHAYDQHPEKFRRPAAAAGEISAPNVIDLAPNKDGVYE